MRKRSSRKMIKRKKSKLNRMSERTNKKDSGFLRTIFKGVTDLIVDKY